MTYSTASTAVCHRKQANYAFISAHECGTPKTKENGRMGRGGAHGVLFPCVQRRQNRRNWSKKTYSIRDRLCPEKLCFGTEFRLAILIFKKPQTDNKVLFYRWLQSVSNKAEQNFSRRDIRKSSKSIKTAKPPTYSYPIATLEEIAENDYNLIFRAYGGPLRRRRRKSTWWPCGQERTRAGKPNWAT